MFSWASYYRRLFNEGIEPATSKWAVRFGRELAKDWFERLEQAGQKGKQARQVSVSAASIVESARSFHCRTNFS